MIPPTGGPPPPQRPSRGQVARRRVAAVAILVLALGGLGWLAVAAIDGRGSKSKAQPPPTTSSTLIYTTVERTVNGQTTETVIAMPKPFHIVFPEGFTVRQMAERVGAVRRIAANKRHAKTRISTSGYLAAVRAANRPTCVRAHTQKSEGFLFPATYEFFRSTTNAQLVQEQLDAFCQNWRSVDLRYAHSKNLTPYDVLIIASMVEKETLSPDERPLVAAVIYNRLHHRMALQIDATIRYGLNIPPTQSIRESQLHSSSPYNTRDRPGLPPTPIANPGLASIQAAAHPANVDYLYFVRKPDKKHHFFTASIDAFNRYLAKHGYGTH